MSTYGEKVQNQNDAFKTPRHELSFKERYALKNISLKINEAIFSETEWDYQSNLNEAFKSIETIRLLGSEGEKFTEGEADISRFLHTFMRKYMDCPVSVILWNMVDSNSKSRIWISFINNLNKLKIFTEKGLEDFSKTKKYRNGTIEDDVKELIQLENLSKEETYFYYALMLWPTDSFERAIKMYIGKK